MMTTIRAEKIRELQKKADSFEKKYEEKMNKLAMDISFEKLETKDAEYKKEALHAYEVSADKLRSILWDGDPIKKQLKARMRSFFKQACQHRKIFQAEQKLIKEKEQLGMQKAALDCLKAVQQKMELISDEFISKIEEVCQKEKQSILQKYDRYCEDFIHRDEVKKYRNNLEDKLAEQFERAVKNNKRNLDLRECVLHVKTALGVYIHGMDQLLENGKNYSELGLLWKHETCESRALREFKNLTANVTCSQSNFRENLMKEIKEKFSHYKQMNRKNYDEEKQRHIKSLADEYENSMKEWAERFFPEDELLEIRHYEMLANILEKFSRLMTSKETAEDKEELKKEINVVYLKIEADNKRARDEKEFLERQKYENVYEGSYEDIFSNTMKKVLEETEDLEDSLDDKILEARIDLGEAMHEVLNKGIQRNGENKERNETRVNGAVKKCVLKYRGALNELMLKSYVEIGGFEEVEKQYIELVDTHNGNEAIRELIKEEIRKETEEAKLQNEMNKD